MINNVSLTSPFKLNNAFKLNFKGQTNYVNFTSSKDVVSINSILFSDFSPEIPEDIQKEFERKIRDILNSQDTTPPIGTGADGKVYRFKIGNKQFAAKVSHNEALNPFTGETQRVGADFKKEAAMLEQSANLNNNNQKYIGRLTFKNGQNVLISTFVEGDRLDPDTNPLTSKRIISVLENLEQLDEMGILHRDLKKENIIANGDEVNLIDFGVAINFNPLDDKNNDVANNFPRFIAPSNIRNFEDTFLMPYIDELSQKDPQEAKEVFRNYLIAKSQIHHQRQIEVIDDMISNGNLSPDELNLLQEQKSYHGVMSSVLANPDDEVIELELLKNQITYSAELAYKNEVLLNNPLANTSLKMHGLMKAKKLETTVSDYIKRPNSIEYKKYLLYQHKYAKYREEKLSSWLDGLVGWLRSCLTCDNDKANSAQKEIIRQACSDTIEDYQIPTIRFNETIV